MSVCRERYMLLCLGMIFESVEVVDKCRVSSSNSDTILAYSLYCYVERDMC